VGAQESFGTLGTLLPRELDAFVGRATELDTLASLLADSPLVTIAGPGGAGKTRLALRFVRQVGNAPEFADGVVLVELAPLADPRLVISAVAASIGVAESSDQPLSAVVTRALRAQRVLLVLDNCEHVVAACADLGHAVLRACPHVRLLATSREPLHISGETVYRLPPLQLPRDDRLESLADSESAQLFVLRARAANAAFVLDATNAAAVADIY
jgi:non-specific serine/threonine protein kinase